MPFPCSICEEVSTRICARCTKDACDNHLCEKCLRCSDCCECEVALDATPRIVPVVHTMPAPDDEAADAGEPEGTPEVVSTADGDATAATEAETQTSGAAENSPNLESS